jgi:putative tryptophan/tyrosine transport system substrate-binding protein
MKRRQFITLLGGAAATWPLAARAQQSPMPVIGFLHPGSRDANVDRLRGFDRGLKEVGYVEGEHVAILYRFADSQPDRLPELATDLVRRRVAVIVTTTGRAPLAAQAATTTIPIVFSVNEDPVKLGLVASLARPGGNLTGVNFLNAELTTKRLEFLHQLTPAAARVAALINPSNPAADSTLRELEAAGRAMGLQIQTLNATNSREIDAAFATLVRDRVDSLFVAGDAVFTTRRVQFATLSARHAIPAAFSAREYCQAGGLMSYGSNLIDTFRQVGIYTGRILKGDKPADLPVVQSTKFELVFNVHTAGLLGLTVPPSLLALADEVIE